MSECFSEYFIKNGEFLPKVEFKDGDIKSGKSVYEVLRVTKGVPMFLERHLARLSNSIALVQKEMLLTDEEIRDNIYKLIEKEEVSEGNIKLVFNYGKKQSDYYFYFLKHSYPTAQMYSEGVDTILYHGERENPNAKVINADFRKNVEEAIVEKSAYEAILVDRDGYITEGSKSNIFLVYNGKVITSPADAVLPGVTRNNIISLITAAGIPFSEERFHYKNLCKLDGLFISGTSPKVLPIRAVDDNNFDSANNNIIKVLMSLFDEKVESYIAQSTKR